MQHLNTARTAGMSKRCSFSQAGDDRPWLRHIRHRRSPRSTRSASTLHAGSLLALARARKASWPALKFSFLPPHALRADACKRQAAWMGIADAWAAAPATAARCCARRASGGMRTEGADARGTALGGRPPMKSPEQARGRIRHTTHTQEASTTQQAPSTSRATANGNPAVQMHLQRAAEGEGQGPRLLHVVALVHGRQVGGRLLLRLAACDTGTGMHTSRGGERRHVTRGRSRKWFGRDRPRLSRPEIRRALQSKAHAPNRELRFTPTLWHIKCVACATCAPVPAPRAHPALRAGFPRPATHSALSGPTHRTGT